MTYEQRPPSQVVDVPAECPRCGGRVCVHDLTSAGGEAHCHDRRLERMCGWTMPFPLDPEGGQVIIRSMEACDAGRVVKHATLPGFQEPCVSWAVAPVVVDDIDLELHMCAAHLQAMEDLDVLD